MGKKENNAPRHPRYSVYADRLDSFQGWVHRHPNPHNLSRAGLFFTNEGDLVRCFQCGIGLKDFSPGDDPLLEHVRHSGQCPFLREMLGEEKLAQFKNRLQVCDPISKQRFQQLTVPRSSYRNPEYQSIEARLSSFANWPLHITQTPQQLAEAGLYYTGLEDQVRCFACDGGLRRWDSEDDPWTEHCRWFPACPFALEQKGEQFIAQMQGSADSEERADQRSTYRHPEYQSIEARLSSLANWPSHITQTSQQLAEAGFYYTGIENQVCCFACGLGLRFWDPEDGPWIQHCRWFPTCPYALEKKGEHFIGLVQASVDNEGYELVQANYMNLIANIGMLNINDDDIEECLNQYRDTCTAMGYKEDDLKEAIKELLERGDDNLSLEDIIDAIEVIRERKQHNTQSDDTNETHLEKNLRLKKMMHCMICKEREVNALFLPCTHHRLCMKCAEKINKCPVCKRDIRQKIRTYMA